MLTTFDKTFDLTFGRALGINLPPFPQTGTDSLGPIAGAVLPFSATPALMGSCLTGARSGQSWERWAGVVMSTADYLLPFILSVPLPANLASSPFCTEPLKLVHADTGAEVLTPDGVTLRRFTRGDRLYILHTGSQLYSAGMVPASLSDGAYRLVLASMVSDVFAVRCQPCSMLKVRLLNDRPLGELLYNTYAWEQVFYVEGELTGPSYEESETRSGNEKTAGTVRKVWTLSLEGASEAIADALGHASLHKLVELTLSTPGVATPGGASRQIRAMAYSAKTRITPSAEGGYDIELTLPVSETRWDTPGLTAAGCGVTGQTGTALTEIDCE